PANRAAACLIDLERALGRSKDLAMLPVLEATLRERQCLGVRNADVRVVERRRCGGLRKRRLACRCMDVGLSARVIPPGERPCLDTTFSRRPLRRSIRCTSRRRSERGGRRRKLTRSSAGLLATIERGYGSRSSRAVTSRRALPKRPL